jgi:hypothetical protein
MGVDLADATTPPPPRWATTVASRRTGGMAHGVVPRMHSPQIVPVIVASA